MELFIKLLTGRTITIPINTDMSVADFKNRIVEEANRGRAITDHIQLDGSRLIYGGNLLDNDDTLVFQGRGLYLHDMSGERRKNSNGRDINLFSEGSLHFLTEPKISQFANPKVMAQFDQLNNTASLGRFNIFINTNYSELYKHIPDHNEITLLQGFLNKIEERGVDIIPFLSRLLPITIAHVMVNLPQEQFNEILEALPPEKREEVQNQGLEDPTISAEFDHRLFSSSPRL